MLLLAACKLAEDGIDGPHAEDAGATTVTPWDPEVEAEVPTPLDLATLQEGLEAVVPTLLAIDPRRPYDVYQEALGWLDATCPTRVPHNGQDLDLGDCSTTGGAFYGYQVTTEIRDATITYGETSYHRTFRWISGAARLASAAGAQLQALGDCLYRDFDDDGRRVHEVYLWASYDTDLEGAGWLGDGLGVELYLTATAPDANARTFAVSGGLTRLEGPIRAVDLLDLQMDDACSLEPRGELRLWDESGLWYLLDWGACDGCADVLVKDTGASVGQACADFTPLTTWEDSPWG